MYILAAENDEFYTFACNGAIAAYEAAGDEMRQVLLYDVDHGHLVAGYGPQPGQSYGG